MLVHADFCKAEIEAEYMWGLVHPSLLNGEGGYYLTTLTSAVNVLKETQFGPEDNQEVKDVCVYTVYIYTIYHVLTLGVVLYSGISHGVYTHVHTHTCTWVIDITSIVFDKVLWHRKVLCDPVL